MPDRIPVRYSRSKVPNILPSFWIFTGTFRIFHTFMKHHTTSEQMKFLRFAIPFLFYLLFGELWSPLLAQEITPPRCYGGNRLTREFILEEMVYPASALNSKTEGTVKLAFTVLRDGSVKDIIVENRVSPEVDAEAIRVFRKILWFPATDLGIPIDYRHTFSVKFKIRKYNNLIKTRGYNYFVYPYEPIDSSNIVYEREAVDESPKPVFSILDNNFQTFLSNNLMYPEAAFKQNLSGTVRLKFVVETSGRVSNILAEKTLGGGCTEEAIRVLKLIKWFPGIRDGTAVRTFMPLEITFDIAKRSVGGAIPSPGQYQ
jgi:protein TonB